MASRAFSRTMNALHHPVNSSHISAAKRSTSSSRTMATEALIPSNDPSTIDLTSSSSSPMVHSFPTNSHVLTTIYQFPTMEPLRFELYPENHLHLPLRRDLLHRAVIFEGDATRHGTASSKTRYEVHGSHRKVRPQKGLGMARLGTKQSPLLKGGGKTFGPHPRDFSTDLPNKMYDLAWRTALSYRYRKGELIVCEDGLDISYSDPLFVRDIFRHNRWGNEHGGSFIVTLSKRNNLFQALQGAGREGIVQTAPEVDVKDLLKLGRVIIEKSALDMILKEHQRDLVSKVASIQQKKSVG